MAQPVRGDLFANRFEVEEVAGSGGMGTVYRVRDQLQNELAALKVLHPNLNGQQSARRFAREAQLLTELRHPGIVRHVAHGIAEHELPYLAMEWLEGESLRQRLQRGVLSLAESVIWLQQATRALAVAHARGVIHRDLKPSNLFLRGHDLSRATLIDFGVARRNVASQALTLTGSVVGTPEYMSPEQARGERKLTPAADIFSLGCIFYECLTGTPPFVAESLTAVLAQLLFEHPPRLRDLHPQLPAVVDDLIHAMLAKEATERPADAAALLTRLEELLHLDTVKLTARLPPASAMMGSDQRLVSVVVTTVVGSRDAQTLEEGAADLARSLRGHARRELTQYGARTIERLDGSLVATFATEQEAATDLVRRATRSALLLRGCWPAVSVAVATGRGAMDNGLPSGEAFERATALLHTPNLDSPQLLLDDVTAGLLDPRFRTRRNQSGVIALDSVEPDEDETRLLLGKATPCIGRDVELAALEGWLATAIADNRSCVVLVTAPPGAGKSRLRHEFLRRVAARGESLEVLVGRGDPLLARSSYGLFGQAVRGLCMIHEDEALEVRRQKLHTRLLPGTAGDLAGVEFLGEVCGIPFPIEGNAELRAAHQDPQLMHDRISAAVIAFLRRECAGRPLLLVFEDLHWSDGPTLRLIELIMSELEELPLMVLALSRPEFVAPRKELWAQHALPLPLHPLSKRASTRLVRQALGATAPPPLIERIVKQAAGNALFLEELIRAAATGNDNDTPPTVLAMLQARISGLDADTRRMLRGASAFGETFWLGGVRALLGLQTRAEETDAHIEALLNSEIIERRRDSRFAGEKEFRFRHALMRDAAYALLTQEERSSCHRLCLGYLEKIGETDPALLCEHALLTDDKSRFLPYVVRAAQKAQERCDLEAAEKLSEIGLQAAVAGEDRGMLLANLAWVESVRQHHTRMFELGREAMACLREGSARWYMMVSYLLAVCRTTGRWDILSDVLGRFHRAEPSDDAISYYATAVSGATSLSVLVGNREASRKIVQDCARRVEKTGPDDLVARGFLLYSSSLAMRLEPTPFQALACAEAGAAALAKSGHRHYRHLSRHEWAFTLITLGRYESAFQLLRESVAEAQQFREPLFETLATRCLIVGLSEMATEESAAEAVRLGTSLLANGESPIALVHGTKPYIALTLAHVGRLAEAEQLVREAVAILQSTTLERLAAYMALAEILLQQGHADAAHNAATEGLALTAPLLGCFPLEVRVRRVLAEALQKAGEVAAAHAELRAAATLLQVFAADAPDAAARAQYLSAVPSNARLVRLAENWLHERLE